MPPCDTTLSWVEDAIADELRLTIVEPGATGWTRLAVVPAAIDHDLAVLDAAGRTSDPADDLVRLDGWLRLRVARLQDYTTLLLHEALTARDEYLDHTDRWWLSHGRHRRWLGEQLRATAAEMAAGESARRRALRRLRALRKFVIALEVPDGVLAVASRGWQRNPARPEFVSRYGGEATFLRADPRRAGPRDGDAVRIGGAVYGTAWRRDGDDDDPHSPGPSVSGPWQLGYIPATGEVYACRRCRYRPPAVWLLARGLTNPDHAHHVLTELWRGHMLAPNSLLHAATVLHHTAQPAAQPDTACGQDL